MSHADKVRADFSALGASLDSHPLAVVRPLLQGANMPTAKTLQSRIASGAHIMIGGMVIARQRPGSAKGLLSELFILARGKVERQGQVVNLIVDHLEPLPMLRHSPSLPSRDFR